MAPSKQEKIKELEEQFSSSSKTIGKLLLEKLNEQPKRTPEPLRAAK